LLSAILWRDACGFQVVYLLYVCTIW
jgi:hypothetical protein